MPQTQDYNQLASPFVILEQTGDERLLTLRGRALPYRPFTLSGSQRNTVEWYPGNPVGVLQVYGAKEETTTINGQWKDVFLGLGDSAMPNNKPYADVESSSRVDTLLTAMDLAELVDDIRRKGQVVVVTWLNQYRYGVLSRFTQKWHTGHDLEWEIEFTWVSQDNVNTLKQIPFTNSVASSDMADVPNQVFAITDQIIPASESFSTAFDPSAQDIVDEIDNATANVVGLANDLADAVLQVSQYATTTSDAQRRLSGVLDTMKINASEVREAYQNADGVRLNLGGSFGETLADRSTMRQQAGIADSAAVVAAAQQKTMITALTAQVLAVFQARDGDDLRKISQIYYGTPDDWQSLMVYNDLDDDQLSAGQIIIVPTIPVAAVST